MYRTFGDLRNAFDYDAVEDNMEEGADLPPIIGIFADFDQVDGRGRNDHYNQSNLSIFEWEPVDMIRVVPKQKHDYDLRKWIV